MSAHNFIDLSGRRVGRLLVISQAPRVKRKIPLWNCICDCGKEYVTGGMNLRMGRVNSCGCLHRELTIASNKTHGLTRTPEYLTWINIRRRCMDVRERSYPSYGGRGITVSPEWQSSFQAFFADMGPRPSGHSIERKDVNGNYCAQNCIWLLNEFQAKNTRYNVFVTLGAKRQIIADWARETGLPYGVIFARLRNGWSPERALTEPVRKKARCHLI